jgi:transcriptional regulator with XRE-family HTH domain
VDGIGDGDVPVGRRVAELRRRAGLSQEGLALRLHRSVSWVAKVEQGRRSLDNVRVLIEVADALGVQLRDLREDVDPTRPGHMAVPALRRALTASRADVQPREPAALRRAVLDVGDDWQSRPRCYSEVAPLLPPLVAEARAAVEASSGDARREALRTLALACQIGQEVAARLGEPDLAWISARLATDAAQAADDPTLTAVGGWRLAHAALRAGDLNETRTLAADSAGALGPVLRDPAPGDLSAYGALRLAGAVAAARAGDEADARRLLADARGTADRLGANRNDHWLTFGAANVGVHEVAIAVELGDPGAALESARRVDVGELLTLERQATHRVHVAHALTLRRRDAEAMRQLLVAERLNPEGLPHDTLARSVVAGMVRRDRRRTIPGVRDLARRLRVRDRP